MVMTPKYTKLKIQKSLTDLEKTKALQVKSQRLTGELERTLKRIDLALIPNIKEHLKNRFDEIKKERLEIIMKKDEFPFQTQNRKAQATRSAKVSHQRELAEIFPWIRSNRYEDFIQSVQETQKKDREHYIKKGEIEA